MEVSSICSYYIPIVPAVLDKCDYNIWSSCLQDYLVGADVWDVIQPNETSASSPNAMDHNCWRKKNALALHAIKMSCGPSFLPLIVQLKSAKQAWDLLAAKEDSVTGDEPTTPNHHQLQEQSTVALPVTHTTTTNDNDDDVNKQPIESNDETTTRHDDQVEEQAVDEKTARDDMEAPLAEITTQSHNVRQQSQNTKADIDYSGFKKAVLEGKKRIVEEFVKCHPEAVGARVFYEGRTALHYALDYGKQEIAAMLVDQMSAEQLAIEDNLGYTTLTVAAYTTFPGFLPLLEVMVNKNSNLPNIATSSSQLPVMRASRSAHKDRTRFLYQVTEKTIFSPQNGTLGVQLLNNCIDIKLFDVAIQLVETFPAILLRSDNGTYPLSVLAKVFAASPSGVGNAKSCGLKKWLSKFGVFSNMPHQLGTKMSNNEYDQACGLLKLVGAHASTWNVESVVDPVYPAMIEAAKNGSIDFINEILRANPTFLLAYDFPTNKTMFEIAIENRQEKIFNLIYGALESKDELLRHYPEDDKTNILHSSAMLPSSSIINSSSGPALQMQRELQWFMEVWNLAKPQYRHQLNKDKLTPHELFIKSHEKLMEAGEKQMKDIAQSSTVVGALIVTIMFAAAFTVPGGNDQNTGLPMFLSKVLFRIFIICDALSLFSSTASVLVFLGILTTRYAEADFLLILPRKLMIGLSTLFFCITTMMIVFCTTLIIMLDGHLHITIPVVLLACVPIILFMSSILPLLREIFMSTFGPSIFDKNTKLPTRKEEEEDDTLIQVSGV